MIHEEMIYDSEEHYQKCLAFEQNGVIEVLKFLKESINYKWDDYALVNKDRYAVVKGIPNIAILLKGDVFYSFGEMFKKNGEEGVGDSINTEYLKYFIQQGVKDIYIIFRYGKIYKISLQDFLCNSHQWTQKEGTSVRSISIKFYKRMNP